MQGDNRPFNPFNKTLRELKTGDLSVLREIAEGWYVEYKREVGTADRIARSVSSFANQYGGCLLFGIASGPDNTASAFPGVPNQDVSGLLQRIQASVSTHVDPTPWFEVKTLPGPLHEIGLPEDRSVIVVWVPAGHHTPYVHSSGRIYRRVGNASDPDSVAARSEIDKLWERGRRSREGVEELLWPPDPPEVRNHPALRLTLASDRLGDWSGDKNVEESAFIAALSRSAAAISFDTFFPSGDGLVAQARSIHDSVPQGRLPTWRFLPSRLLSGYSTGLSAAPARRLNSFLDSRTSGGAFRDECVRQRLADVQVFDLDDIWVTVSAAIAQHRELLRMTGGKSHVFVRATVSNVLGWVPFLGLKGYQDQVKQRGLPRVQTPTVRFDNWVAAEEGSNDADQAGVPGPKAPVAPFVDAFLGGYPVFALICHLCGVSLQVLASAIKSRDSWFGETLGRTLERGRDQEVPPPQEG